MGGALRLRPDGSRPDSDWRLAGGQCPCLGMRNCNSRVVGTLTRLFRESNRSLAARPIPAGKRIGEARDRPRFLAAVAHFLSQRLVSPRLSGQSPRKLKTIPEAPGNRICAGLHGGPGSPDRTSIRKKNGPSELNCGRFVYAGSTTCDQISYGSNREFCPQNRELKRTGK